MLSSDGMANLLEVFGLPCHVPSEAINYASREAAGSAPGQHKSGWTSGHDHPASHHRPGVASARFREAPKWRESTTDGIVSIK